MIKVYVTQIYLSRRYNHLFHFLSIFIQINSNTPYIIKKRIVKSISDNDTGSIIAIIIVIIAENKTIQRNLSPDFKPFISSHRFFNPRQWRVSITTA